MGIRYHRASGAYIKTIEGWLYLTVVVDLADRKVVGRGGTDGH